MRRKTEYAMLCHFIAYRHPGDPYDDEDDDSNDDDGNDDDGNYLYIIGRFCLSVCLCVTKNHHFLKGVD